MERGKWLAMEERGAGSQPWRRGGGVANRVENGGKLLTVEEKGKGVANRGAGIQKAIGLPAQGGSEGAGMRER